MKGAGLENFKDKFRFPTGGTVVIYSMLAVPIYAVGVVGEEVYFGEDNAAVVGEGDWEAGEIHGVSPL